LALKAILLKNTLLTKVFIGTSAMFYLLNLSHKSRVQPLKNIAFDIKKVCCDNYVSAGCVFTSPEYISRSQAKKISIRRDRHKIV
jgi:hypothetical protein